MRIAIIGVGNIGQAAAARLIDGGHEVILCNSRGPETLQEIEEELGQAATAETVEVAAKAADAALLATPFAAVASLPVENLSGKLLIDSNNFYPDRDGPIAELDSGELASSEWLSKKLPGVSVVKALNTMQSATLLHGGRPKGASERLAYPVASDDVAAKQTLFGLLDDMGFDAVDGGSLSDSRRQEPDTPVYGAELDAAGVAQALESA